MSWTVSVVTIFPQAFEGFKESSLVGKAQARGLVNIRLIDPRDFTTDRHRSVDDAPYGGGAGMVMCPEPLVQAIESAQAQRRVLLTPQGQVLSQRVLQRLAQLESLVLVCGRYEGFDERVRHHVDEELSLGDFVVNGGEVAAMAVIEGAARLVPGVIGNAESLTHESHANVLLEYPQYTRPAVFREQAVPDVLLSGDHGAVDRWRRAMALRRTRDRRPDLWAQVELSPEDRALLEEEE
jgi:tRNA (guanine37-N1)-methyltransferase